MILLQHVCRNGWMVRRMSGTVQHRQRDKGSMCKHYSSDSLTYVWTWIQKSLVQMDVYTY